MYNQTRDNSIRVYVNQQPFMSGPHVPNPAYDRNFHSILQYPCEVAFDPNLYSSGTIAPLDQMAYVDSGALYPSPDSGILAMPFLSSNQRALNENAGATKILVNPHFKKNVHINPNFKQAGLAQAMNIHIKPHIQIAEISNEGEIRKPAKNIHFNPARHIASSGGLRDTVTGRCASNIHVNPQMLKSDIRKITSVSESVASSHILSSNNDGVKPSQLQVSTIISEPVYKSKNKLIRIPVNSNVSDNLALTVSNVKPRTDSVKSKFKIQQTANIQKRRSSVISRYKLIKSGIEKPTGLLDTKLKQVKKSMTPVKRMNLLQTRYKIIKSKSPKKGTTFTSDTKLKNQTGTYSLNKLTPLVNRYQLDNRNKKQIEKRVRYVYVDKFYNITHLAKNILIKKGQGLNSSKPGYVHINGILYKKSPNSIKRASLEKSSSGLADNHIQLANENIKLLTNTTKKFTFKSHNTKQNSQTKSPKLSKMKKLVKISPSKLRKSNVPCSIYRKFGRCGGKDNGKCIKIHNPKQIVLCTKFLQGACVKKKCLLSHEISPEKMPTCKYFLEGSCSRDDCQYLHVKISPKADICVDFLQGFCNKATECDKRHQYLCPEFEKCGKCPRKRCSYPHGQRVRKISNIRKNARKCSDQVPANTEFTILTSCNKNVDQKSSGSRYYDNSRYSDKPPQTSEILYNTDENLSCENEIGLKNRPKLGSLPIYIPLVENKS